MTKSNMAMKFGAAGPDHPDLVVSVDGRAMTVDEAIRRMRETNYPPGKVVRLIAKSPSSPAFREAWTRLRELADSRLEIKAVFTAMKPGNTHLKKVLKDYIAQFGLTSAQEGIRLGASSVVAKMQDQLQFGEEAFWSGDAAEVRRAKSRGLVVEQIGEQTAQLATETFEIAWELSNPVSADVALKAAIEVERQLSREQSLQEPAAR